MEHIQSKRDCVPGVTAIYFVEPTEQNVSLILDVSDVRIVSAIRTLQKSSRLLERRVVSTGIVMFTLLVVELSTVEWTMPVVNRVCMTRLLFASKEVPDGMCCDLQIFPTIWQNAF